MGKEQRALEAGETLEVVDNVEYIPQSNQKIVWGVILSILLAAGMYAFIVEFLYGNVEEPHRTAREATLLVDNPADPFTDNEIALLNREFGEQFETVDGLRVIPEFGTPITDDAATVLLLGAVLILGLVLYTFFRNRVEGLHKTITLIAVFVTGAASMYAHGLIHDAEVGDVSPSRIATVMVIVAVVFGAEVLYLAKSDYGPTIDGVGAFIGFSALSAWTMWSLADHRFRFWGTDAGLDASMASLGYWAMIAGTTLVLAFLIYRAVARRLLNG